jgi:uncharacterized membrane protein
MIEIIPNFHPVFVHFPIAFATAAVFFIAIGMLFKTKTWAKQCLVFGRWMLWAAAIFAGIAAMFGWFAFNSVKHDEAGHLAMTLHRNWALVTLGALVFVSVLDLWAKRSGGLPAYLFLALLTTAWLLVIGTAWHGGELVYRHGLGVMSLPVPEVAGHNHEHGEGHDELPAQAEHHEDAQDHGHDDTANSTDESSGAGHTHAPGTPPHAD